MSFVACCNYCRHHERTTKAGWERMSSHVQRQHPDEWAEGLRLDKEGK